MILAYDVLMGGEERERKRSERDYEAVRIH
jgi:hypothetical protein